MSENQEKLNGQLGECIRDGKITPQTKLRKVKFLVRLGAEVNALDKYYYGPMVILACRCKQYGILDFLLEKGADIDACDSNRISLLMWANLQDNMELVDKLIKKGANLNLRDKHGMSLLMWAHQRKERNKLDYFINQGADVNIRDADARTMLMLSSMAGDKEMLEYLISKGAGLNVKDKDGQTALMLAYKKRRMDVVDYLIENKADLDVQDSKGKNLLMMAYQNNDKEMIDKLIENKANLDIKDNEGKNLLMMAYQNNDKEMIDKLIESKANLDIKDNEGENLLMMATKAGDIEFVKKLVEKGADVNGQDKDGQTALMLAYQFRHKEVGDVLLLNKADVNLRDRKGQTALMWAIFEEFEDEVIKISKRVANFNKKSGNKGDDSCFCIDMSEYKEGLNGRLIRDVIDDDLSEDEKFEKIKYWVRYGADVNARLYGRSVLSWAKKKNAGIEIRSFLRDRGAEEWKIDSEEAFKLALQFENEKGIFEKGEKFRELVEKGASIDICDEEGTSLLAKYVYRGCKEEVLLLIKLGADVNARTNNGRSVLSFLQYNVKEIAKILVDNGADVNYRNENTGRTLLMQAIRYGEIDCVEALVLNGADIRLKDEQGRNAYNYADLLVDYLKRNKIKEILYKAEVSSNVSSNNQEKNSIGGFFKRIFGGRD